MAHRNEGIVVDVREDYALVMPNYVLTCEETTCKNHEKALVEMINTVEAKLGDKVRFESKGFNFLAAIFVVYMLPMIMITLGAIIGYNISSGLELNPTAVSVATAVLFFALSVLIIKLFDRHASKSPSMKPVILEIVESFPEKPTAKIIDITDRIVKRVC